MRTKPGIEVLCENPGKWPVSGRIGLLANPASVDGRLRHSRDLVAETFPGRLAALYSPQHGFFAEKQDNMVESPDSEDSELGIPIYSLYGKTRKPTAEMLEPIDTLIIDLQDVGTRVYTFIYTMSYCMESAKELGKRVVVLDRPNPVNGTAVEGNIIDTEYSSFVGRYPIPMRHGLTIGEIATLFNEGFGIGCDLTVIPMENWRREMVFKDTGLAWVPPSPNLPTPDSAMVYPGQVLWEGTNVSEGRGTTRPFEYFGAPFIDPKAVLSYIDPGLLKGAVLRPVVFEPVYHKWSNEPCRGFQIHVTEPGIYRPYITSLAILQAVIAIHGENFRWKEPPYEYEHDKLPIDLIIGDKKIRKRVESLEPIDSIEGSWIAELDRFIAAKREFHLYD